MGMGKAVGHGCERAADGSEWMLGEEVDVDENSLKIAVSKLESDNVSGKRVKRIFSVTLSLGRSATH
ncbi:uncharacterized, partial [Tachysurus ichikawai]